MTKVNQSDASAYIGAPLTEFFTGFWKERKCILFIYLDSSLNSLFKLAKQLRIKGLENNIAAFFACKVYIKLNLDDYKKKKEELGIKIELTPQRSKELK